MQFSLRTWGAPFIVASLVATGCGGGDDVADEPAAPAASSETSEPVESAAPTTATTVPATTIAPTTPTSVAVPVTEAEPEPPTVEFATPPASCLELPALLAGLPDSDFRVMTEDRIFDCLGVESFQSDVSFDGTLPQGAVSLVALSTQRLTGGIVSAESQLIEDGVTTEDLVRIGDDFWSRDASGVWTEVGLDFGLLFGDQIELRLAGSGALFALASYAGGAEQIGEVELSGRTVIAWEADAQNIEDHVNSLAFVPAPVGVNDGFVRLWTTPDGLIVKLEGELRAADITLGGLPVDQIDPVSLGLPPDALDIVPDYAMDYELFNFDHDIEITAPEIG